MKDNCKNKKNFLIFFTTGIILAVLYCLFVIPATNKPDAHKVQPDFSPEHLTPVLSWILPSMLIIAVCMIL